MACRDVLAATCSAKPVRLTDRRIAIKSFASHASGGVDRARRHLSLASGQIVSRGSYDTPFSSGRKKGHILSRRRHTIRFPSLVPPPYDPTHRSPQRQRRIECTRTRRPTARTSRCAAVVGSRRTHRTGVAALAAIATSAARMADRSGSRGRRRRRRRARRQAFGAPVRRILLEQHRRQRCDGAVARWCTQRSRAACRTHTAVAQSPRRPLGNCRQARQLRRARCTRARAACIGRAWTRWKDRRAHRPACTDRDPTRRDGGARARRGLKSRKQSIGTMPQTAQLRSASGHRMSETASTILT
ncbi:hypothetical protein BLAT2472_20263 [Burkholderia latens]